MNGWKVCLAILWVCAWAPAEDVLVIFPDEPRYNPNILLDAQFHRSRTEMPTYGELQAEQLQLEQMRLQTKMLRMRMAEDRARNEQIQRMRAEAAARDSAKAAVSDSIER